MATFLKEEGLTYDNISIVPSLGIVESRSQIGIEGFRVIVAGMSSIIGEDFLKEWAALPKEIRPMIHLVRDKNSIKHLKMIAEWGLQDWIFVGVGLNTPEIEDEAAKLDYKNILIDIAFGGLPQLKKTISRIRIKFGDEAQICTGSISTQEQAAYLDKLGVNILRGGVATGYCCSTRYQAGVYVGAVTEIINLNKYKEGSDLEIIADGGFKYPCDIAKAFLLGADYIMSGSIFTKCKSAQMHIDGSEEYFGMSNHIKGLGKGDSYDESFTRKQEKNQKLFSLQYILERIWNGVKSTVSYSGFNSISNAIGGGNFIILRTPIANEGEVW